MKDNSVRIKSGNVDNEDVRFALGQRRRLVQGQRYFLQCF